MLKKIVSLLYVLLVSVGISGCVRSNVVQTNTIPVYMKNNSIDNMPVKKFTGAEPIVALTFDDGPSPQYTPMLLKGLKDRDVRATFFLIGESIKGNESIVQQMYNDGHQIGSHTYSHIQLTKYSLSDALEEIKEANDTIYQACGSYPDYIRPPYGSWNTQLQEKTNMNVVLWNVDPCDWKIQNKEQIVARVLTDVGDGSVILLHDIYEPSVEAALEIVDTLQASGYQFATIEELLID